MDNNLESQQFSPEQPDNNQSLTNRFQELANRKSTQESAPAKIAPRKDKRQPRWKKAKAIVLYAATSLISVATPVGINMVQESNPEQPPIRSTTSANNPWGENVPTPKPLVQGSSTMINMKDGGSFGGSTSGGIQGKNKLTIDVPKEVSENLHFTAEEPQDSNQ